MKLDFMDGVNLMALIIGVVYAINAWQIRRCSSNVNQINNSINAIVIRQTLIAERYGIELPSMDEVVNEMGCAMPGTCTSLKWDTRLSTKGTPPSA